MRTCDICHTPIPIGTDKCPNCGYRYRPEKKIGSDKNLIGEQLKKEQTSTMKHHDFEQHPFDTPLESFKKSFNDDDIFTVLKNTINQSTQKRRPNTSAAKNASQNIKKAKTVTIIALTIVVLIAIVAMIIGIVFANVHIEQRPNHKEEVILSTTEELYGVIDQDQIEELELLVDKTVEDIGEYYEYTDQEYDVLGETLQNYTISSYGEMGNVTICSYLYHAYSNSYEAKYLYVPIYGFEHEKEGIQKAFTYLFDNYATDGLDGALKDMENIYLEKDYGERYTCSYWIGSEEYQLDLFNQQSDLGDYVILRILFES